MSADDLDDFYIHTVAVETLTGTSGYGEDLFATATDVVGWMEESRRLVRDKDGQQVVSESTFYADPAHAAKFKADSRVTFEGVPSRVIRTSRHTSNTTLDLPDHIVVALT